LRLSLASFLHSLHKTQALQNNSLSYINKNGVKYKGLDLTMDLIESIADTSIRIASIRQFITKARGCHSSELQNTKTPSQFPCTFKAQAILPTVAFEQYPQMLLPGHRRPKATKCGAALC
jgi:hypothetical protein